jgi:hypothetical protein
MPDSPTPLSVELAQLPGDAYAGQWHPLTLLLKRAAGSATSVRLLNVSCLEKDVQLDTDLFQPDTEVRPGETYSLTVPLRVTRPQRFDLAKIKLQVDQDLVDLPNVLLEVRPAIGEEIKLRVEPVCSYEEGTKVVLTFEHRGTTSFSDFTATFSPEESVHAGKRVLRRASFGPGDEEKVPLVFAAKTLAVKMTALADGRQTGAHQSLPVPRPSDQAERRFRFLEPRRLASDQKFVYRADSGRRPIAMAHAAYPLRGGESYEIEVRPQNPGVTRIKLHDVPGVVSVRREEADPDRGFWKFLIDVTFDELFSRPERLFYDVTSKDGPFKGEVHLQLKASPRKHLQAAAALGGLSTIQGVAALVRLGHDSLTSVQDALANLTLFSDYDLLFLLCIPILWVVLMLYDRIQYRLRT